MRSFPVIYWLRQLLPQHSVHGWVLWNSIICLNPGSRGECSWTPLAHQMTEMPGIPSFLKLKISRFSFLKIKMDNLKLSKI